MGRRPCCSKEGINRGAWTAMEDKILTDYIKTHGEGQWRCLPTRAGFYTLLIVRVLSPCFCLCKGLKRCGKSCRLRWMNYLRPDIKRGNITHDEEDLIIRLHRLLGNRWSLIAGRLPGRTDNEIKNYWNTNQKKVPGCPSLRPRRRSINSLKQEKLHVVRTKASRCTNLHVSGRDPLIYSPFARVEIENEEKVGSTDRLDEYSFSLSVPQARIDTIENSPRLIIDEGPEKFIQGNNDAIDPEEYRLSDLMIDFDEKFLYENFDNNELFIFSDLNNDINREVDIASEISSDQSLLFNREWGNELGF